MLSKFKSRGLKIWHVYIEDYSRGGRRVPQSFCSSQKSRYNLPGPVLADPGGAVVGRFVAGGIPVNVIFTTKDMKIVYKQSGYSRSAIESTLNRYLP